LRRIYLVGLRRSLASYSVVFQRVCSLAYVVPLGPCIIASLRPMISREACSKRDSSGLFYL